MAVGLCNMHYGRWWRCGDPFWAEEGRARSDGVGAAANRWKGDDISYNAAHQRVRRARGSASGFVCVAEGCQETARDWTYNHEDPNERHEVLRGTNLAYSTDTAFYEPRCASCHSALDHPSPLTAEDAADVCVRYEQGESRDAIAEVYSCGRGWVQSALLAGGAVKNRLRDERIRAAYATGAFTLATLSQREGLSTSTVHRIARGVSKPRRGKLI